MKKLYTQIQDYTANIHSPRADYVVSVVILMAHQQEQPSGFWWDDWLDGLNIVW